MAKIELVGKLTAKSLGWDRAALQAATKDTKERQFIGTVVGIVNNLRQTVNDETGDIQTGLKGNFRGVSSKNLLVPKLDDKGNQVMDGTKPVMVDSGAVIMVNSGVCYLPGGIQEMIEGALAQAQERDPKATVPFALDLYCIADTNKAGYTFRAETKVEPETRDPLDALLEAARAPAALPAPDAEPVNGEGDKAPEGEKSKGKS